MAKHYYAQGRHVWHHAKGQVTIIEDGGAEMVTFVEGWVDIWLTPRANISMLPMSERQTLTVTHMVNVLGEAIQRFDDAAVTRDYDPPVDSMRDAAEKLHYYLQFLLTRTQQ